ncbi:uncharacterized protein LOC143285379 [Babylonia areolata]|uniref:uncharacterized protein LOC143285379 n=1 Tax=Babylonia areolata TaxID=304850 RepID=UPI003FD17503
MNAEMNKSTEHVAQSKASVQQAEKKKSSDLYVGDRVVLPSYAYAQGRDEMGIVRWIGVLPDETSSAITAGVEFDNPIGTGTGKYKQHRLFYARHGHASLVPLYGLIKEEDFHSTHTKSSESQLPTPPGRNTDGKKTSWDKAKSPAVSQKASAGEGSVTAMPEDRTSEAQVDMGNSARSTSPAMADETACSSDNLLAPFTLDKPCAHKATHSTYTSNAHTSSHGTDRSSADKAAHSTDKSNAHKATHSTDTSSAHTAAHSTDKSSADKAVHSTKRSSADKSAHNTDESSADKVAHSSDNSSAHKAVHSTGKSSAYKDAHNTDKLSVHKAAHNTEKSNVHKAAQSTYGSIADKVYHTLYGSSTRKVAHSSYGSSAYKAAHSSYGSSADKAAHSSYGSSADKTAHSSYGSSADKMSSTDKAAHSSYECSTDKAAHSSYECSVDKVAHSSYESSTDKVAHSTDRPNGHKTAHSTGRSNAHKAAHSTGKSSADRAACGVDDYVIVDHGHSADKPQKNPAFITTVYQPLKFCTHESAVKEPLLNCAGSIDSNQELPFPGQNQDNTAHSQMPEESMKASAPQSSHLRIEADAVPVACEMLEAVAGTEADAVPAACEMLEAVAGTEADAVPAACEMLEAVAGTKADAVPAACEMLEAVAGTEADAVPVACEMLEAVAGTKADAVPAACEMLEAVAGHQQDIPEDLCASHLSEPRSCPPVTEVDSSPATVDTTADDSVLTDDGKAILATAAVSTPADRECKVCLEDMKEPKVLPCGHMMCQNCLVLWMKSKSETLCPLCRSPIWAGKETGGKEPEQIADSFFTDRYMMKVVEAAQFLRQQHACKVCATNAALFLCLTCGDVLCTSCTFVHDKLSTTRHHSVRPLDSLTPEELATKSTVYCMVHSDRPADLFCQTHGVPICLPCAKSDHRRCAEVRYLEEHREDNQRQVLDLTNTLSAAEGRMMQKVAQLDSRLLSIGEMEKTGHAYVDEKCHRLTTAIQACRRRLTEQVHGRCSREKDQVAEEKKSLLNERSKFTLHRQLLGRVQELPVLVDVAGLQQTVQSCVDGIDQIKVSSAQKPLDLKFAVDENLLTKIEEDISALEIL